MKKHRKLFRNFLSVLLIFVLCFTAAMTAFAEGEQSDTEPVSDPDVTVSAEADNTDVSDAADPGAADLTVSEEEEPVQEEEEPTQEPENGEVPVEEESTDPVSDDAEISEDDSSESSEESSSGSQPEESTEESSAEESTPEETVSGEDSDADLDAVIAEMVESIREEYGDEAAESFEKVMSNPGMRAYMEALQKKLEAEFPGMTAEEISEKLESMSDDEALAMLERIFNDPEIIRLSEALAEDEELAEQMEILMELLWGDIASGDDINLEEPVSGNQGDNISWTLDTDGTLTISGSGPIVPSYEEFDGMKLPFYEWDDYIDNISKVVIKDGVTDIPADAFSWSSTLKTVVIPASVKSIGAEAFAYCENLTAVYFQGDAPEIAEDAFDECSKDLTLYYREGTKGWDKVTGYKLAVWNTASSGGSREENGASSAQETAKTTTGSPDTGDSGTVWPFILLMAAAVICGGAVIIRMRRKR
ncbi:MAG: leucine-rich repeat protein [Lachnospiraceae bacterium]